MHAAARHHDSPSVDQRVTLHGIAWETYLALDESRGDMTIPRLTFDDGVLELMSPAPEHERVKKTIARLLEFYAAERDIALAALGSTTFRDEVRKFGVEPDECYFVGGEHEGPPDLVVEVVWTSGGVDKLRLYALLGVREVWIWHRGRLSVHGLVGDAYEPRSRSAVLPDLDLDLLSSLAGHPDQVQVVRAWRAALRGPTPAR